MAERPREALREAGRLAPDLPAALDKAHLVHAGDPARVVMQDGVIVGPLVPADDQRGGRRGVRGVNVLAQKAPPSSQSNRARPCWPGNCGTSTSHSPIRTSSCLSAGFGGSLGRTGTRVGRSSFL